MKSTILTRILGLAVAMQLVACAHEIPMSMEDNSDAASNGEASESEQVWEDSKAVEPVEVNAQDTEMDAQLENMSEGLEGELAPTAETEVAAASPELAAPAAAPAVPAAPEVKAREVAAVVEAPASEPTKPAPAVKTENSKNRYYVVRAGDTPEYVSMLLYKSADKAGKLVAWNGPSKEWKAGTVLFYVSPEKPQDARMQSFYEERGLASQAITVQAGDSLPLIAERHLGSAGSAKELLLVNGLKEGDTIQPGQLLQVYPSPLLGQKSEAPTAKVASNVTTPAVSAPAPVPTPVVDSQPAPVVMEKASSIRGPAIITLAPAPPVDAKAKASLASTLVAALFVHHPLVLGCTVALLALFGVFFYLQRRRGGSHYDF